MIAFAEFAVVVMLAPMLRRAIHHHRVYWFIRKPGRPHATHGLFTGPQPATRLW